MSQDMWQNTKKNWKIRDSRERRKKPTIATQKIWTEVTYTKDLTTEPSINQDHVEHSKGKKYRPEVLKTTINTISK